MFKSRYFAARYFSCRYLGGIPESDTISVSGRDIQDIMKLRRKKEDEDILLIIMAFVVAENGEFI